MFLVMSSKRGLERRRQRHSQEGLYSEPWVGLYTRRTEEIVARKTEDIGSKSCAFSNELYPNSSLDPFFWKISHCLYESWLENVLQCSAKDLRMFVAVTYFRDKGDIR